MTLSISAYLDTLAQHRTRHASPSPLLALSPHLLLVLAALHSVGWLAWVHVRARRDRKRSSEGLAKSARRSSDEDERAPLLSTSRGVHAEEQEASEGLSASGWELVLEAVKVLVTVALFGLSLAKLTGYDNGKWELVLEGGIIGLTAYLTLSSAAKILNSRVEEVVRQQQIVLSLALVAIELAANIEPFAFIRHPHITLPWRIAFAQTVLSILMGLLLLLTPPRWTPRRTNVPPNPAQTASPLSVLFFSFLEFRMFHYYLLTSPRLAKLFRLSPSAVKNVGFRSFVPPLPDVLHSEYVLSRFRWEGDSPKEDFDSEEERKKAEGGKKSEGGITMGTAWQFAWHQRWEAATIMAFASGWIVFIFLSPLSMYLLLRYVQSSEDPPLGLSPYVFVLGVFFAPIASSVCFQSALYRLAQLGLRLRSLLGHAVYAKLLRVMAGGGGEKGDGEEEEEEGKKENGNGRQKGRKQSGGAGGGNEAIGRVNNLVGTDVDTITSSLPATLQLYGVLPKLVISLLGLELLLGWSAFVSLAVIIAFIPVSRFVAGRYGAVQGEIMKATDRRITIVQELLNSIRIVKTFAWEKASMKRIEEARDTELERIIKRAKVYAGMMFLSTGIPAIVTLSTFGAYVFGQGETLTASTAFTAMSLFGLLREAVISATFLLSSFMRARVSLERITHFIADTEELDSQPRTFTSVDSSSSSSAKSSKSNDCTDAAIVISANSQFRFSRYGSGGFTLSTASNDSTKELRFPRGRTTLISGDVGSGKSAMLLALLGELHVKVGGIEYRIEKNATEVDGKKGARKENGRVKLSYAAQNPWLQDDSIRANILFGEEFDEERYNQTVFACSLEDDLDNLPKGDETRVGEKGLSLSGGQKQRVALARAIYSRSEIVLLDDVLSALDSNMVSHVVEHCLNGPLLENRTVVLVTHFVKLCVRRVENLELVIHLRDGKVTSAGPPSNDLAVGGSGISRSPSHGSMRSNSSRRSELHQAHVKHGSGHEEEQTKGDSSGEGSEISWDVYKRYAKAMGGWTFWLPYAVVNILAHVFMLGQGWFIGRWVNAPDAASHAGRYFALYAAIQVISSISLTAMYLALIWGAVRASRKLYDDLTKRVFAAPFRWWDRTPLGNVVNRNSKDTEILDTEQVENLQPVLDYSVQVLFVAIIIAAILPIFFIPASLIFLVFFLIANLYIRSALAARKQVSSSRSPLFSTLGDTTSGVTTIRAFGREQAFAEKYKKQTDEYNRAQLYEEGLDRWLEERSDTVGAAVSFVVGILCLSSGLSSGVTGFLISTGLEFTSRILYVVRAVNKNELSLNSVQRILQYSGEDVPVEEAHVGKKEPPAHWPSEGGIEFDDFSARYSEDGEDVLHSLTLSIKPGEKIGIVGPSGCGKSSLSLALLRFIITSHGSIRVDGRELNETNLDAIRSRMTLVPQDPTLFSGSLRSNLDPNDEHDDSTLWNAIKRSGFIQDGSSINLDSPVSSGGANFSQGQRQLVSLARALVRNSRILILDEATASLDDKSDEAVQRVVREEFAHATNLVVAHRLDSVIDFDRILVLRAGRIVEFDAPLTLLDREDSLLRELVDATGRWDELCAKAKKAGGGK